VATPQGGSASSRGPGDLGAILSDRFGHPCFRVNQEEVCKAVAAGDDALLVMPTGSGKSLCYQLPGIARGGTTLVISPLIALMEDQTAKLRGKGFRAAGLLQQCEASIGKRVGRIGEQQISSGGHSEPLGAERRGHYRDAAGKRLQNLDPNAGTQPDRTHEDRVGRKRLPDLLHLAKQPDSVAGKTVLPLCRCIGAGDVKRGLRSPRAN